MSSFFKTKRVRQPQYRTEINKHSPLYRGTTELILPLGLTAPTMIRGFSPFINAGTITGGVGELGRNISIDTATLDGGVVIASDADDIITSTSSCTILLIRRSKDTVARESMLFGYAVSAADRVLTHAPWSDGNLYWDFGGTGASQRISVAFAKSTTPDYLAFVAGPTKGREVWRNGIKIVGDATKTGARVATAANFRIGAVGTNSDLEEFYYFHVLNRELSDIELKSWYEKPWQIFAPQASRFLFSSVATATAALTGTVTTATEADIVTGGRTIVLTLTGDTWVAAGATFDGQRQNIINGIDSAQAEATGWDAVVKALQGVAGVVRTNDNVVTITLDAQSTFNITATETITNIVPASALTGAVALTASPTFNVTAVNAGGFLTRNYWWQQTYGNTAG